MVLSVMVAVSTGFAYDISAYGYESPLQQAYMESNQHVIESTTAHPENVQEIAKEHIQEAAAQVDAALQAQKEAEEKARREAEEAEARARSQAVSADSSERDLLALIVMAEAGCEDMQGQIMVANVVLNRVRAGYGSSIADVIYAPGQFDPVSSGTLWSMSPTASVYEAVERALAGEDYSQGALYFVSSACDYSWFMEDLTFITQHGGHLFFR